MGSDPEHQAATAQERWPRGASPRPRSGAAAERSYCMFKVRRGGREKIPLVQAKEQRLRFAGAAVKRYPVQGKRNPSKTVGVARGHQRADTEHRTTVVSNSMKLSHAVWGHPRRPGHGGEV